MKLLLVIAIHFLFNSSLYASFSSKEPSINGTAETLPTNGIEVGFASFSYGIANNLMLTIPTLPLLFGDLSAMGHYKLPLNKNIKLRLGAGAGYSSLFGSVGIMGDLALGIDLKTRHTLTAGVSLVNYFGTVKTVTITEDNVNDDITKSISNSLQSTNSFSFSPHIEYDYYTNSGNLFYVGFEALPYLGFTWAWENVHLGLLSSLVTLFIPFPYIYFRF